ncbi:MAG: ABC transporter transmembrane domain-containing protein [Pseudomonadota bacterium]
MPPLWSKSRRLLFGGVAAVALVRAGAAAGVAAGAIDILSEPSGISAWVVAVIAVCGIALVLLRGAQRGLAEAFALSFVADVRHTLFSHAMRAAPDAEKPLGLGLIMTRVVNDLTALKMWLSDGLAALLAAGVIIAGSTLYLALTAPAVAPLLAAPILAWLAVIALCALPLRQAIKKSRRARGRVAGLAGKVMGSRLTFLVHGRHDAVLRSLEKRVDTMAYELRRRAVWGGFVRGAGDLVLPVAAVSAVLLAASSFSAAEIGTLIIVLGFLTGELAGLAAAVEYRIASRVASDRINTVLARPAVDPSSGSTDGPLTGPLVIDGLPLPGGRSLSLHAEPGERIALIGLTLSDQAALTLAMQGFQGPHVRVGEARAGDARLRDWWRSVAVVGPADGISRASTTLGSRLGARAERKVLRHFGLDKRSTGAAGPTRPEPASRVARAIMRRPQVLLITDPQVIGSPPLVKQLLSAPGAENLTVVFASPPRGAANLRPVAISEPTGPAIGARGAPLHDFRAAA